MTPLTRLRRKIDKAIDASRGVGFTASDIDLLVVTGAYGTICGAANDQQRQLCLKRSAKQHSIDGDHMPLIGIVEPTVPSVPHILPSSGTIPGEDASEALPRAKRTFGKGGAG